MGGTAYGGRTACEFYHKRSPAASRRHRAQWNGAGPQRGSPRLPAMTPGLRDLKVWQEAVALGGEVARTVHRHARRETRELTERLLGESLTLAAAVADGSSRPAASDQRERFRDARRALLAVE